MTGPFRQTQRGRQLDRRRRGGDRRRAASGHQPGDRRGRRASTRWPPRRRRRRGRRRRAPRCPAGPPPRRPTGRRCWPSWPSWPAEHADELVAEEVGQTGKPVRLATEFDVPGSIDNIDFFAGAARHLEGKATAEYSGDHTSSIRREAVGVVATITPWNYPLQMAVWKVIPALAAGCAVVIKPAEITPLTTLTLARLASEAGLPDGVLNVVTGAGADVGTALAGHPRRRPGHLHRIDRRRPQGDGRRRRARPPHPAGTRRQGAVRGVRRRRPRRRHPGRGRRVADQHRAGLHRGHPGDRRARPLRRLRRRGRRGDEQDRRRRPERPGHRPRPADLDGAPRQGGRHGGPRARPGRPDRHRRQRHPTCPARSTGPP